MGMAGNAQYVPFEDCACGKKGFREEKNATRYMLNKQRCSEPVDKVKCPVGECWHTFNPAIRDKADYTRFLTETSGRDFERRRRVGDPPTVPPQEGPSACAKIAYASEKLARAALEAARGRAHETKRAYACPICSRWHLTSREFDPTTIVDTELLSFAGGGESVIMFVGRYPDGTLAGVSFKGKTVVRIRTEHAHAVRAILDLVLDEETGGGT